MNTKKNNGASTTQSSTKNKESSSGAPSSSSTGKIYTTSSHSNNHIGTEELNNLASSFIEAFENEDDYLMHKFARKLRKAMSQDENPPLDDLVATGVLSYILDVLDPNFYDHTKLLVECAWITANLASGTSEHVQHLLESDIITKTKDLLEHPSESVKENAVWILANVSGDSLETRDLILEDNFAKKFTELLDDQTHHTSFLTRIAWLISNLCRGRPYPQFQKVKPLMKIIEFFMLNTEDEEIHTQCCWALSYLADGNDEQISAVVDLGLSDRLVELMVSKNGFLKAPALRAVANILCGEAGCTNIMIESGVIPALSKLLDDPQELFRKEAGWALSNLLAGTSDQVNEVITYENGEILIKLTHMALNARFDVSRECLIGLTNACAIGSSIEIQILINHGILGVFVEVLRKKESNEMMKTCIEALLQVLDSSVSVQSDATIQASYIQSFNECGGFEAIKSIKDFDDSEISTIAKRLIDTYCLYGDD